MSKTKDELNSTPADPIFTPSELYELIKFCAIHFLPILIVGSPGQGKTTIVTDVAKELGYDLILTHPVTDDPTHNWRHIFAIWQFKTFDECHETNDSFRR
jgi:Ni2+-binding GTPase involved in maturation of urease and hydrogenase